MNNTQMPVQENPTSDKQPQQNYETIFCSTCGAKIAKNAISCPHCGAPVAQNQQQPQIVINNSNSNVNTNTNINGVRGRGGKEINKWVAFLLCFFLGFLGAHKFYEGRIGGGILYLLTVGLFGIGWFIDTLAILFKPNPYYV